MNSLTLTKLWNTDRIKHLRDIAPGKSAGELSEILTRDFGSKVSRNSIIGICHRRGIAFGKNVKPVLRLAKPRERMVSLWKGKRMLDKSSDIGTMPFPPSAGRCLSIVGEPKQLRCCGMPVSGSPTYCETHTSIFYTKRPIQYGHLRGQPADMPVIIKL